MSDKTLDEHAEAVERAECTADMRGWPGRCPLPEVKAAYWAERSARQDLLWDESHIELAERTLAAEARVRELEAERDRERAETRLALVKTTRAWADAYGAKGAPLATGRDGDPPTVYGPGSTVPPTVYGCEAEARVRELEVEEAGYDKTLARCRELLTGVADALKGPPGDGEMHDWSDLPAKAAEAIGRVRELEAERDRHQPTWSELDNVQTERDEAQAALAETRDHLARLREAASRVVSEFLGYPASKAGFDAFEVLRAALATPGPTLAEIRRTAQAEVLREMAAKADKLCEDEWEYGPNGSVATECGRALADAASALRQCAADLDTAVADARIAEARVRELEARHAIRERVFDACARAEVHQRMVEIPMWRERAQKAEAGAEALEAERLRGHNILVAVANALGASGVPAEALPAMIAETRAQLARLREAAAGLQAAASDYAIATAFVAGEVHRDRGRLADAIAGLRAALSTPGPTLAELRAAVLEEAAERIETAAAGTWISGEAASALLHRLRTDILGVIPPK